MVLLNRSLIIILAYAFTSFCSSVDASDRPNVLLIVSEDNGPELGCYDDPYAQTPHLDRLAGEGIIFRRAYVPQSGCSQSRASYLTGLYPTNMVNLDWLLGDFDCTTMKLRIFHVYSKERDIVPVSLANYTSIPGRRSPSTSRQFPAPTFNGKI